MNRADNLVRLARDGIKENAKEMRLLQQDTTRLQKIIDMFGVSDGRFGRDVKISTSGRRVSSGWKVGVSRDLIKLFNNYEPEVWLTQDDLHRILGESWAPGTIANAVNKLARDGFLIRQGDRGSFRYARVDNSVDPDTMKAGDGNS
jgi:Predicted transcriptional regulator